MGRECGRKAGWSAVTCVLALLTHTTAPTTATGRPPQRVAEWPEDGDCREPPPTPTGSGGECPFLATAAGGAVAAASNSTPCPKPAALRAWQGLKFGLFLHWGPYSQIGVDASWSLNWKTACTFGNVGLCAPKPCSQCTEQDMTEYRQMYWGLSKTFNPTDFDPDGCSAAAAAAGMKYFVMTTKHHDGFAMFNTTASGAPGQPVYGVTGPDCPAQRDFFGEVAASMRRRGLKVGAYFSKADWHANSFWDPAAGFATDRNTNYDIATNPARYEQFVSFDGHQLGEIERQYSPDLIWLDAGWVGPNNGLQTLPLPQWAAAARVDSPAQLWVNRDGRVAEDYLTPENPPPDKVLSFGLGLHPKPWEVCMTLGEQWAYKVNDTYKTTTTIVHTLVSVVATGGSLLLDVGPMPTGQLPPVALERLAAVGHWLGVNGEAIYDTTPIFPYAMNVTTASPRDAVAEWRLAANATKGLSASCPEAGANTNDNLTACQARCFAIAACNTINFREGNPPTCIAKGCKQPGEPLVAKDGGWDVYIDANAAVPLVHQWLLSKKADDVYAMLITDGGSLPPPSVAPHFVLPFVVNVAGGIDGSWPRGTLGSVSLLGGGAVSFEWSDRDGLVVANEGPALAAPDAAVFKLTFSPQ